MKQSTRKNLEKAGYTVGDAKDFVEDVLTPKVNDGYQCLCGKTNKFSAWVFAHWTIEIVHTCECGRKNTILGGRVVFDDDPAVSTP